MILPNTAIRFPHFPLHSLSIFLLLSLPLQTLSLQSCPTTFCTAATSAAVSGDGEAVDSPPIRFPFSAASGRCGYPGFRLSCNNQTQQPTISLSTSGDFTVQAIDYVNQLIWLSDPAKCLPKRLLTLTLTSSPFSGADSRNHTFLNCTAADLASPSKRVVPVACLSGKNFTVYATARESTADSLVESGSCNLLRSVLAPILWPVYRDPSGPDLGTAFVPLSWEKPDCGDCERRGGVCGFASSSGLDVGCSVSTTGASRMVKYGLVLGLGVPGFLCLIGLLFYYGGRLRQSRLRQTNTESSPSVFPQPAVVMVGLDGRTIASYPETLVGESRRVPGDPLCSICLSEYEAKETLRTIPECNHYFHARCIDEWLRLNGSCPLCRNSPPPAKL